MNKLVKSLLLSVALSAGLHAQCPVGNYIIGDQTLLNKFQTQYPECEELDGLIANQTTAYDLSPLRNIKKIKGNVTLNVSFHFQGLSGLSALKEIGGTLRVDDMDSVLDFSGLETLERIGGDFLIVDNSELVSLSGLTALKEIGGRLEINNNSKLKTLFTAPNLLYLGLTKQSHLHIEDNPFLEDLQGLQGIKEIKGRLYIESNKQLRNIEGLSGLTLVDSSITLYRNDSLENTRGLRNLEVCNGTVHISTNPGLKVVDLPSLKTIGEQLSVSENTALHTIAGMNSLTKLDKEIIILGNIKLDTIRAFNALSEVGALNIGNIGRLPDYSFFRSLKKVTGTFQMGASYTQSLAGLDSLAWVGQDFYVQTSASTLAGLEGLRYVGRKLHIGADSVESLSALADLDTVRELTVSYCHKLTSLSGIDNLNVAALGNVLITFNRKLNQCGVKSICDLQAARPKQLLAGNNTGNCADTAAIRKSCADPNPVREEMIGKSSPRPSLASDGNGIQIRFTLREESRIDFRVYDPMGKFVAGHSNGKQPAGDHKIVLPIADAKSGLYLIEIRVGSAASIRKIML